MQQVRFYLVMSALWCYTKMFEIYPVGCSQREWRLPLDTMDICETFETNACHSLVLPIHPSCLAEIKDIQHMSFNVSVGIPGRNPPTPGCSQKGSCLRIVGVEFKKSNKSNIDLCLNNMRSQLRLKMFTVLKRDIQWPDCCR
jgi:hypothetical protein